MAAGSKNGILSFDSFKLDSNRLMLYRDDEEVLIPPKVAKTLAVLVENAGTIISKSEVIEQVWDDSIVEEANLTQYLYLLRKILGPMPDGKPYIETLRRRGYRFNGRVERIAAEPLRPSVPDVKEASGPSAFGVERDGNVLRVVDWQPAQPEKTEKQPDAAPAGSPRTQRSLWPRIAIAMAIVIVLAIPGVVFLPRLMPAATNAESQRELSVVRLTNGQMPFGATISPDGNVFVYSEDDGDISRLFVQQTGQTSRIAIASSGDMAFGPNTFSPDGQSVYYLGTDKTSGSASLYRLPTMGGASIKILDDLHGPVAFSPDGKEIVFSRRNAKTNEAWLVIADRDGRTERVLLHRKGPAILVSPAWSPDGKLIAFGEFDVADGGASGRNRLKIVDVATGQESPYSDEIWDNILRLVWSPVGSGVIMIGTRANEGYSTRRDQVYFVSYPDGKSQRITTDGNRHEPYSLGVTRNGEILSVPANRSTQVWVMNGDGNTNTAVQLTRGAADGRAGLGPLPDGRFGYLARTAEEITIMISDAEASSIKELATGFQFVEELRSDPFGKFFVFSSVKDGKNHMFRIDVDTGTVKQLTFKDREIDSTISPDGKYLTYDSCFLENGVETFALKRIPVDGGEPVTIKPKGCFIPTYSPDGALLSCIDSERRRIMIVSATDGSEIESHPLPTNATWNFGIGWTPDGSGLIYVGTEKSVSNLWIQPRDGSKPRSLTSFSSGIIYRYAFAHDGSKLYLARGYPTQDAILIKNFR